jgi:hypothetical protein
MRGVLLCALVLVVASTALGQTQTEPTKLEGVSDLGGALGKCPNNACELDLWGSAMKCTRTDGGACFAVGNGVWLRGTPGTVLKATDANISSILSNADPSGNQEYWFATGIGVTSQNSRITGAALDLQSIFVNSYLRDSVIYANANTWAARFQNNGSTHQGFGPFLSENNWYTGQRTVGSKGVLINDQPGGGNFADFTSIADTFENFDKASTGVSIVSNSGQLTNIYFLQPHWESSNAIGFDVGAARNVTIDSPTFGGCCSAQTAIQIESGAANVWVRNMQSSWANAIVDKINGRTITTGTGGPALIAQYAIGPPATTGWNNRGFIYAANPGGELEIMRPGQEELRMSGTGEPGQWMEHVFYGVSDSNPTYGLRNDGLILQGQGGTSPLDFCIGERHGTRGYWGIFDGNCKNSYFFLRSSSANVPTALRVGDANAATATLDVAGSATVSGNLTLTGLPNAQLLGTDSSGKVVSAGTPAASAHVFLATARNGSYNAGNWYTFYTTGSSATQVWRLMASVYQDNSATCSSYGAVNIGLKWTDARGVEQITSSNVTFAATPAGGFPTATPDPVGLIALMPNSAIQVRVQYKAGVGCSGGGSTYTAIAEAEQLQ